MGMEMEGGDGDGDGDTGGGDYGDGVESVHAMIEWEKRI